MLMRNKFLSTTRYMKMAPDDGGGGASSSPAPSGGDSGGSAPSSSPADSGGASPASAPDSGSPSATPAPSAWDALGSVDDLDEITIPDTPEPVAAPVAPAPVAPPVATPPAAPTAQQVQPPVAPATPASTQPPAGQPTAPELSPSNPLGIAEAMHAARSDVIAHLAQDRFALSQEDIAELESDAAAFVPKMMARVMFEAQTSMMKFLSQSVPGMIQSHGKVSKANTDAENSFFEAHKALGLDPTNNQHREVAFRMANLYRQANPNMPMKQLIAEVGPIVAASLGVNGTLAPQTSAAPAATPPRGGTPFRPAVNGGGGASPAPAQQSEWAGLGANYDDG